MTQFICNTQHASIQLFTAPSGMNYTSLKGLPFNVSNKKDAQHFSDNYRFDKVGVVQRVVQAIAPRTVKPSATEEQEGDLDKFMSEMKMSDKSKETVKKLYASVPNLYAEFVAGATFPVIPKKHAKELKDALEEYDNEKHTMEVKP